MSYASSAGSHRMTSGEDVLGGVDVPVVPGAAGRALPGPRAETQLREQVPARRAGLRAGIPPVDHDQLPPVPLALVLELAAELAPAAVRDHAGLSGSGHAPLVAGQVAGLAFQVPRIGDPLTVRCHSEVGDAEIDTHGIPGLRRGLRGVAVYGEGHVPAPVAPDRLHVEPAMSPTRTKSSTAWSMPCSARSSCPQRMPSGRRPWGPGRLRARRPGPAPLGGQPDGVATDPGPGNIATPRGGHRLPAQRGFHHRTGRPCLLGHRHFPAEAYPHLAELTTQHVLRPGYD